MTSETSLLNFLQTGTLAPLTIGMSQQEVGSCLGEPDDVSTFRKQLIWKYGPLQLTFDNANYCALAGISLYPIDLDEPMPPALCDLVDDPILSRQTSVRVFESYLELHETKSYADKGLTFGDQIGLRTGPGVSIVFCSHGAQLDKILYYTLGSI